MPITVKIRARADAEDQVEAGKAASESVMASKAGSAITIGSPVWRSEFIAFIGGGAWVAFLVPFPSLGGPSWVNRVPTAAVIAYMVAVGLATIWLLCRAWRIGVRFDDNGVTVRNFWRTYRIARSQISHLADGLYEDPQRRCWALKVVLSDGQSVRANYMTIWSTAKPKTLVALRTSAARYGIAESLTGQQPSA